MHGSHRPHENHHLRHHHHEHGIGHNHDHDHDAMHLHSHLHGHTASDRAEELKVLSASFVEGFRSAEDKSAYLRLAGIPFSREGDDGLTLHLVDAAITSQWQVGTASPAFGSRELSYLPYPGEMISGRETMTFTYVSLTERQDADLLDILAERAES